jgi:hypothetical protein
VSEEKLQELTSRHDEALQRMEDYERKQKSGRITLITTLLTALGLGGGSGVAYFQDDSEETMQTVVASHIAADDLWKENADRDLEDIKDSLDLLRDAVARMQGAADARATGSRGRGEVGARANEVDRLLKLIEFKARKPPKPTKASRDDVQALREQLFAED